VQKVADTRPAIPVEGNRAINPVEINLDQEKPSYERGLDMGKSYASAAGNGGSKSGYQIVERRKAFAKVKAPTPDPISRISVWERHLKIRFVTDSKVVTKLVEGTSPEVIRTKLNGYLRDLNERKAYFAISGKNRFGDILRMLADSKVDDIVIYLKALGERLKELNLPPFRFESDTEKVKIYVGMILLTRAGRINWCPEDWNDDTGFRAISNDIENSNPGLYVTAKPWWVGGLRKMHNRKQSTASMILVVEKTKEITAMMSANNPRINIGGRSPFSRAWREENASMICARFLKVGHVGAGCDAPAVCKFYRQSHMTINHVCWVAGCYARGVDCAHCRR